jgi:transcriptional regulator with XRE-family HTH domain
MKATELYKLRKVLGLTQAGLAKAVGVTSNAIALAERGERGIGEPMARLVKLLVRVHTGELVPKRRPTKRGTR